MWSQIRQRAARYCITAYKFVLKKAIETIIITVAVAVGGYVLNLFYELTQAKQQPAFADVPAFLVDAFGEYIRRIGKWFIAFPSGSLVGFFKNNLALALPAATILVAFITFWILVWNAKKLLDIQSDALRRGNTYKALLNDVGLAERWPHARVDGTDGAPWKALCDDIKQPGNHEVCILGANGIDTFGGKGAPLYDALSEYAGSVRVILTSPDSSHTRGRAAALGMAARDYARNIKVSVARLRDLRAQNHAIEGRFYNGQPNWKLIITNRTIWVQYYRTGGPHVDQTPVYRFDAPGAFYQLFRMEFDRIWSRCHECPMPLSPHAPTKAGGKRKGRR